MYKINHDFICRQCNRSVPPAIKTCRNHCPYCFASSHVDKDVPGDRASDCMGLMFPTAYKRQHNQYKIQFTCTTCGKKHRNKQAHDDAIIDLPGYIEQHMSRSMQYNQ